MKIAREWDEGPKAKSMGQVDKGPAQGRTTDFPSEFDDYIRHQGVMDLDGMCRLMAMNQWAGRERDRPLEFCICFAALHESWCSLQFLIRYRIESMSQLQI